MGKVRYFVLATVLAAVAGCGGSHQVTKTVRPCKTELECAIWSRTVKLYESRSLNAKVEVRCDKDATSCYIFTNGTLCFEEGANFFAGNLDEYETVARPPAVCENEMAGKITK